MFLIINFRFKIRNSGEIEKFRYPIVSTHVFSIQLIFEHWNSYEQFIYILSLCAAFQFFSLNDFLTVFTKSTTYILSLGNTECSQYHLKIVLESLTFFTITTFRTFCHLSVICVVHSDLKIVSQQKNGINS